MANIVLNNVNKIYPNNVHAVFDFNIDIKDKEFIVFVGPSGCGKSTTLRMIAGLEEISTGEFLIDGKLTNFVPPKDRNISMVFQNYALYPHMTVYKNMSYGLKIKKDYFPTYEPDEKVIELLKKVQEEKKRINLIVKKMVKDSDNATLKMEYMDSFNLINESLEEILKIRKPIVGLDEKRLKRLEKEIESNKKELDYVKGLIEKENNENSLHEQKLLSLEEKIKALEPQGETSKELLKAKEEYEFEKQYGTDKDLMEMFVNDVKSIEKIIAEKEKEYDEVKQGNTPILQYRHYYSYEIDAEVFHAASILDLELYLHRFPAALSGGQRQRVALGRAIVRRPKVFLMDEPLSNLDAKLRVQTRVEILKLHRRVGATTIYVTHDQTEAMTLADRIVIMKDGRVQQIDKPLVCFEDPANIFVAGFIGSPAMNFVHGHFANGVFTSLDGVLSLKVAEKDAKVLTGNEKEIVLGIRPEHILIGEEKENNVTLNVTGEELLGTESIIYSLVGDNTISVKTNKTVDANTKDLVVSFDKEKFYFFDAETTMRIK